MVASDKTPEDKQKLKSALTGVVVLLVISGIGALFISEFTGVDIETLCVIDEDTNEERCVENDDAKSMVTDLFFWASVSVGIVAFFALLLAGIKY